MPASGHDPRLEYSASNESLPASAPFCHHLLRLLHGVFREGIPGKARPNVGDRGSIYTIHEGKREEFVKLFDEVLLPAQRQIGLEVLGQFISIDDQQTFLWLRRFDSQEERWRRWDEFYGSDLWRNRLGPRANPLMKDSSNVIAVEPTPGSAIQ
jgi:NIPSNAP